MIASRRQVVEELLDARLVGDRRHGYGPLAGGSVGSRPRSAVDLVHLLGPCVIRLQFFVGDRPSGGDTVVMPQFAEVLLPQTI